MNNVLFEIFTLSVSFLSRLVQAQAGFVFVMNKCTTAIKTIR